MLIFLIKNNKKRSLHFELYGNFHSFLEEKHRCLKSGIPLLSLFFLAQCVLSIANKKGEFPDFCVLLRCARLSFLVYHISHSDWLEPCCSAERDTMTQANILYIHVLKRWKT